MNGFLLTRVSQFKNATCDGIIDCEGPDNSCKQSDLLPTQHKDYTGQTCIKKKTKVMILLVDAFRYDFALYNDSIQDPEMYQNKIKVINTLLNDQPNHSRLFTFVADPPTTTMQRLKGLTTGSLPTFIDAGSNFASHEINEDNILDQLVNNEYKAVFMGDDTWTGLYPRRFVRSFPYPSFNVWDLDTVDDGVLAHLYNEMDFDDWKLIVAHFLGVDHCGHRYGPSHPEMSRKLTQMNDVIEKVIKRLDDDTVLFVIGDHGMTSTGDHGGESTNEINAAMFAYSKRPFSKSLYAHNNTVKQVDLVPTLSTLLGVPIPHSNLGSLIHDCIPADAHTWKQALIATWANAQQLTNYIREYSKTSQLFPADQLYRIFGMYETLKIDFLKVRSEDNAQQFAQNVNDFILSTRKMCEEIWIQFDAFSMARGLLLISTVTIFVYLIIEGSADLSEIVNKELVIACYTSTAFSSLVGFLLYFFNIAPVLMNTVYFAVGLSALLVLAFITVRNFQEISSELYTASKSRDWTDIINRVVLAFSGLMFLSNSFILEESKVMLFFLLTLILIQLVQYTLTKVKNKSITLKLLAKNKLLLLVLIMCVMIRVSMNYWRCREEQGCNNSIFLSSKTIGGRVEWAIAAVTSVAFIVVCRIWLRTCGNLNGLSFTVLVGKFGPTTAMVSTAGFWILHGLPTHTKTKLLGAMQPDILAWLVYAITILGILTVIIQPLCVYHLNDKSKRLELEGDNIIPQLAKHVFDNKNKSPPVVYGLATVYSAAFLLIIINLVLIWLLVLDYVVVPSCIALLVTIGLALLVNAIAKFENCKHIEDLLEVSPTQTMIWFAVSIYMFYATGHQPAFPNISWEAAFVGTVKPDGELINHVVPAILVLINTFGSYIVMGLSLPLILISPFSFYVMMPSFISKRNKLSLSRGELELYDRNDKVGSNIFKLCCNYSMCHIIRVFAIMLSSTIHCRHLMVWNVFAPKLLFEAIALFITLVSVFLGFALFIRVNHQLDKFVVKLSKQMS